MNDALTYEQAVDRGDRLLGAAHRAEQENKRLNSRLEAHKEIFSWLMGETGSFPPSEAGKRYAFRSELRKRLAMLDEQEPES